MMESLLSCNLAHQISACSYCRREFENQRSMTKVPDVSIAAACRWSVLFFNVLAIVSLITYGIRSDEVFGKDDTSSPRQFIAALFSILVSTGLTSYCFIQKRISETNVGSDGATIVSAACASHTFICFILFARLKPGSDKGEIAAFLFGLSCLLLTILHTAVTIAAFRCIHKEQPEVSSDFYSSAKQAIDDCFSVETESKSAAYKPKASYRKATISLEDVSDSFVVIE